MREKLAVTEDKLGRQVEQQLDSLRREFAQIPASQVTELGQAQFNRLRAGARITDFIPVFVHRYTREDLLRLQRDQLRSAA